MPASTARRLLCLFALLVAAPAAADPGIHLSWDHCSADGRIANRDFACDTNSGSEVMVVSFESPLANTGCTGVEILMQVFASDPVAVPAWWQFRNAGSCRAASLSFNLVPTGPSSVCEDPWGPSAGGGVGAYQVGKWGPNTAQIVIAVGVTYADTFTVGPGIETFACNLVINHAKTVGAGACAGCTQPVCIGLGSVNIASAAPGNTNIRMDALGLSAGPGALMTVTWQGAYVSRYAFSSHPISGFADLSCAASAPVLARARTWGQLRSLYR